MNLLLSSGGEDGSLNLDQSIPRTEGRVDLAVVDSQHFLVGKSAPQTTAECKADFSCCIPSIVLGFASNTVDSIKDLDRIVGPAR